ncbi:alcohol dehydrogenase catalytic domain-containing protein [Streptomyces profundus]|uniref:alcohol dehydrogenase catalytic domain-containing protein n=1 Tax=Streptomyces profundus TaxID=2867410 RepID=UPI001D166C22|nr:zinc-binding dehydrogenase [Streptomyces sp. MA3_2.13]UED86721.1 zinc-binding dehydrogenase [Streptomyces sp. MA3_2.13]
MKQAVYHGIEDVRIQETEVPVPGPGEIVVRNRVTLTCGTDVKMFMRGYRYEPPHLIGHEAAGVVHAVGEGVTRFAVGDRVVAHNTAPCHACYYCKKGNHSMCVDLPSNLGAYAEYQLIPARIVRETAFAIPEGMDFEQAALTEPLACAVYGTSQVPIELGDTVVVNGCGPIGLMFVRLAHLRGAIVIAADVNEKRLALAERLGARHTVVVRQGESQVDAIKALTEDGRGVDIAIEATGLPQVWELAFDMVCPGGTVLFFGGTKSGTSVELDCTRFHYDQITAKGVFHTTPIHVRAAFELLRTGAIRHEDFVQNSYELDDLEAALREHARGDVIKNVIRYP